MASARNLQILMGAPLVVNVSTLDWQAVLHDPERDPRDIVAAWVTSLIPQRYYEARIDNFKATFNRDPCVLPYHIFVQGVVDAEFYVERDNPYSMSHLHIATNTKDGSIIPYYVVRDEDEGPTKGKDIPTLLFDLGCEDYVDLWATDVDLTPFGLEQEPKGLSLHLVDPTTDCSHLKRWSRYLTRVRSVDWFSTADGYFDLILPEFDSFMSVAAEAWATRHSYPFDLDQISFRKHYLSGNSDTEHFVVRVQQDKGLGYGLFTKYRDDELYWAYSIHDGTAHVGNNILLAAIDVCRAQGLTLNLGIGYFDWKALWSRGNVRYQRGVRFLSPVPHHSV